MKDNLLTEDLLRVLFMDHPSPIKIDKKVKKQIMNNPNATTRQKMGLFYTDKEKEKYVRKSLKRKLP